MNSGLSKGVDANGGSYDQPFHYDASTGAASTIGVNALTPSQIAAVLPSAPGGNGNALNLAALGTANVINGSTFSAFYGGLAGRAGGDLSNARAGQDAAHGLVTQAQSLRQQSSGVSLDEEATRLVAYKRGYQAASKLIGVLDTLTQNVIDMIK